MVRLGLIGAAGRMGTAVREGVRSAPDLQLTVAVERPDHPLVGGRLPEGIPVVGDPREAIERCDVIVDFSRPEASLDALRAAATAGRPAVIGTTGFSREQLEEIRRLSQRLPCVFSPNMSLGVNLLVEILRQVALVLGPEYDVEILEVHHRWKRDAPSGTALRLAEAVARARGASLEEVAVYGRQGIVGERPRGQIGLHALRGGEVVGEHVVMFCGPGERLELVHRAQGREAFVRGALAAARWVVGKPPGLYGMRDVLGLP